MDLNELKNSCDPTEKAKASKNLVDGDIKFEKPVILFMIPHSLAIGFLQVPFPFEEC